MRRRICSLIVLLFLTVPILGCGGEGGDVPEGTPATPEPGSHDYDKYSSGSRNTPGASHGAGR